MPSPSLEENLRTSLESSLEKERVSSVLPMLHEETPTKTQ